MKVLGRRASFISFIVKHLKVAGRSIDEFIFGVGRITFANMTRDNEGDGVRLLFQIYFIFY